MSMEKSKLVSTTLIFFVAIAVLALDLWGAKNTGTIEIQSNSIPILYPHAHHAGDSVMSAAHHVLLRSNIFVFQKDTWVSGISGVIENAPRMVLHHGELLRLDKIGKGSSCPTAYGEGEILNFGQDQMNEPELHFPSGSALFIPRLTPVVLSVMLHNPLPPVGPGGEYRDVKVRVIFHEATTSPRALTPVAFHLLHLDQKPCVTTEDGYVFSVPAHSSGSVFKGSSDGQFKPAEYSFDRGGTIVYMGAHLHGWEGGRELRVYINGSLFKTFTTVKSVDSFGYNTPHFQTAVAVKAGDTISIDAVYDNPASIPLSGAMGMMGFYFKEN